MPELYCNKWTIWSINYIRTNNIITPNLIIANCKIFVINVLCPMSTSGMTLPETLGVKFINEIQKLNLDFHRFFVVTNK